MVATGSDVSIDGIHATLTGPIPDSFSLSLNIANICLCFCKLLPTVSHPIQVPFELGDYYNLCSEEDILCVNNATDFIMHCNVTDFSMACRVTLGSIIRVMLFDISTMVSHN